MELKMFMRYLFIFMFGCLVTAIIFEKTEKKPAMYLFSANIDTDSISSYTLGTYTEGLIPLTVIVQAPDSSFIISTSCYGYNGESIYERKTTATFDNVVDSIKLQHLNLEIMIRDR